MALRSLLRTSPRRLLRLGLQVPSDPSGREGFPLRGLLPVDFLVLHELSSSNPVVFACVGKHRVAFYAIDLVNSADVAVLDMFISLEFLEDVATSCLLVILSASKFFLGREVALVDVVNDFVHVPVSDGVGRRIVCS